MACSTKHVLLLTSWLLVHFCVVSVGSNIVLQGAGSNLPLALYSNAFFSYRFEDPNVQVTFDSSTVGQAICRLTNYSAECAATDTEQPIFLDWASVVSPLASDIYQRYPDLQLFPTVASAVVPIYNLNNVTDLVLSMETLAKIWSGRITTWDHADIQATNPGFASWNVPTNQSIRLVADSDSSGSTELFKKAMAGVDSVFDSQVGTSAAPMWNGTQVVFQAGSQLIISHVMRNRYTLGYAPMGDALTYEMPTVKLNRSGVIVEASSDSVEYAMLERGVSFGDNGDAAAHLTADLYNADNPLAWPITSYAYLAVRKSTLRPGATCTTVYALVAFWLWFWNSDDVATLAAAHGFSVLPNVVNKNVVTRFKQEMYCGGSLVWEDAEVPVIEGYGPGTAITIFDKFQEAYELVNNSVALNYTPLESDQDDIMPLLQAGGFIVSTTPYSSSTDVVSLVLAAQAVVAISQFVLTLDGRTLARILNGDIQTWLHPDILALNPDGIRDSSGNALNDTTQTIVLLQGPTVRSAPVTALLKKYYPAYTGTAILASEKFADPELLWAAVLGTPYSFSLTAFEGTLPEELQLASIMSSGGIAVAPSLATAKSCADNATYDTTTNSVSLALDNRSCYPLLMPLYVNAQLQCPTQFPATLRVVTFLQWMFSDATLDATLDSLNLVSLDEVSDSIKEDNYEALFQLSCGVRSTPTDITTLLLAVIIPIAVVVLTGIAACGWWLWRITEYNRALRKKFSNDNVAESCAEAIARFDLAAVAWLKEVKEPNKIQKAFLAIITLLTEVKPYIPDQLLSRLITSNKTNACNEEETDNEAEPLSGAVSESHHRSVRQQESSYRKDRRLSMSLRTVRSSVPSTPTSSRKVRKACQSISSSDGAKQVLMMKDWTRKRCTYMCVRFGSTYQNAERRLMGLAQVTGRIVDVAKANGATIDAVGVDFVNVHWGVTTTLGVSSSKAVQSGLEMGQLRDTLPEDQQAAFWLQIGIGRGLCDCGTVSSESGHRFFVVWGSEASLALEVAMTNLPKRVLTSLLVSPAVYQEVQFTVHCMPRLWHGETLLWEPRCVLKEEDDDEWMYELKKMNEGASLNHKTLLAVFLMAKDKATTAADLAGHIAELKSLHGSDMSAQDIASLDLLLTMERPHDDWDVTVDESTS